MVGPANTIPRRNTLPQSHSSIPSHGHGNHNIVRKVVSGVGPQRGAAAEILRQAIVNAKLTPDLVSETKELPVTMEEQTACTLTLTEQKHLYTEAQQDVTTIRSFVTNLEHHSSAMRGQVNGGLDFEINEHVKDALVRISRHHLEASIRDKTVEI